MIWFQASEGSSYVCLNILKTKIVCNTHPTSTNTHTNPLSEHYIKLHTWQLYNEHSHSCYSPAAEMIACTHTARPINSGGQCLHVGSAFTCVLWFKRSMSGSVHLQTPKNILKVKCPLTLMNCGKYHTWGSHGEAALIHASMHKSLRQSHEELTWKRSAIYTQISKSNLF